MSYGKILWAHKAALATYEVIGERLSRQKKAIETQIAANAHPNYMQHVVEKIGKMVCRRLGKEFDFYLDGPFGICNESHLTVFKKTKRNLAPHSRKTFLHLTFTDNQDGGATVRDYSKTITRVPENSIGAANGMNHPDIEIPTNANAAWFIKMAGKRI